MSRIFGFSLSVPWYRRTMTDSLQFILQFSYCTIYADNCNAHIIPSSQTTSKMYDPLPVLGAMRNPLPCMAWDDDIVLSVDIFFFKRFLKKELGPRTAKLALLRIKFIKYGIKQFLLLNMKIWRKTQSVYTYIFNIHC